MFRKWLILGLFLLSVPVLAQRGGGSSPPTDSVHPDCTATSGSCPIADYVCVDIDDTIWRCEMPNIWSQIGGSGGGGGGGTSVALDLSDDDANESSGLTEIATSGDDNSIFTNPASNKLLIDVSQNWPGCDIASIANTGGSATAYFSSGQIEDARLSAEVVMDDESNTFSGSLIIETDLTLNDGTDADYCLTLDRLTDDNQRLCWDDSADCWEFDTDGVLGDGVDLTLCGADFVAGGSATPAVELTDTDDATSPDDVTANLTTNLTTTTAGSQVADLWIKLMGVSNGGDFDNALYIDGDATDDQWDVKVGSGGEVGDTAAAITPIQTDTWVIDPGAHYDVDTDVFLFEVGEEADSGIQVTEWKLSCDVDPDVEIDANLRYANAWIGLGTPVLMDAVDTTAGVASEGTPASMDASTAAKGKVIYLDFDADPEGTCVQMIFQMWWYAVAG